jgi:pimeloyl-ACP methyl ester carboxylesterase
MPHKRNPVLTENVTGLARMVRSYAIPAMENVALWHERDISHSSVERYIGPDATITLDFALARMTGVIEKLVVSALAACLRRPNPPALTDEGLATLHLPVLVVLGDADFAGPADPLLDRLPNAKLVTLPGVDHFATPKSFGFIDATLEFLDALP